MAAKKHIPCEGRFCQQNCSSKKQENQFQNRDTKPMHLRCGLMSLAQQTRKRERRNLQKKEKWIEIDENHPLGLCLIIFMILIFPINIGVYNLFLMIIKTSSGHQIVDKSLMVTNFGAKCVRSWRFLIQCICKLVGPRLVLILVVRALVLVLLVWQQRTKKLW